MTDALVLGAGMAGVSAALALQARGRDVALIHRVSPGSETSFGNAGIIQAEAVEPYALPRFAGALLKTALRLDNALNHLFSLPAHALCLWSYFRRSAPARHRVASAIYRLLVEQATVAHAPLIEAAGADALISREGFLQARRCERDLAGDLREAERLGREYGVAFRGLDQAALTEVEPSLRCSLAGAIHWTGAWSCADPGALVAAYADPFLRRGGRILKGDASSLTSDGAGWRVTAADGPASARDAVMARGPWSPALLAPWGYRIPMVRKRGCHRHSRSPAPPRRPFVDGDLGAIYAPMRAGLRIFADTELAAPEAPVPETASASQGCCGRTLQPWRPRRGRAMARRQAMPSGHMLPLVGRASRHQGLWLHFGHGHHGFTLWPATSDLLARAMDGERDLDIDALSPAARPAFRQGTNS